MEVAPKELTLVEHIIQSLQTETAKWVQYGYKYTHQNGTVITSYDDERAALTSELWITFSRDEQTQIGAALAAWRENNRERQTKLAHHRAMKKWTKKSAK